MLEQPWSHPEDMHTTDAKTIGTFLWRFHDVEGADQADETIMALCEQAVTVLRQQLAEHTHQTPTRQPQTNTGQANTGQATIGQTRQPNHQPNNNDNYETNRHRLDLCIHCIHDEALADEVHNDALAQNALANDLTQQLDGQQFDGQQFDSNNVSTKADTTHMAVTRHDVANHDIASHDVVDVVRALVQTLTTWAKHLMAAGFEHRAQKHLEHALVCLRACPALVASPLHYYLRVSLCICWYIDGRYHEVITCAEAGIASAQRHEDWRYEARLRNTQGLAFRVLGDYRQAVNALTTSQHLYERLDHADVKQPIANLASLFHYLGREQQALAYFEQALALGRHYQKDYALTTAQLGDIHLERQDFAIALDYYRSAINQLESKRTYSLLAVVLANAAIASLEQDHLSQAESYITRALELNAAYPHKRYRMIIHYSFGLLQRAQGHLQDAHATLEDALQQAQTIGEKRFQAFIHQTLAEVCAALGDMTQAYTHERQFSERQQALLEQKHQRELAGLMLDIEIEREQQAREKAEYALKAQTKLLERITDGFLAIDEQGVITYANHIISDLTQLNQHELVGKHTKDTFPHLPKAVWQRYQAAVRQQRVTTLEFYMAESQRWYDLRIYPGSVASINPSPLDANSLNTIHEVNKHAPSSDMNAPVGSTVYLLDITERKKQDSALKDAHFQLERAYAETAAKVHELEQLHLELASKNQALEQLSQQDGLTKLFNRRTLDTLLAQEFERAERYHTPLSVMLCDIDNFKQVNDTLSHAVGDDVLRQIALIFSQHTRNQDIVARYGGEEFVIVFTETPLKAAAAACDNLRHLVANFPWHTVHPKLQVTLSMGVTDKQNHTANYEAILQAADKQMYRAKTSGKNRVCLAQSKDEPASTLSPASTSSQASLEASQQTSAQNDHPVDTPDNHSTDETHQNDPHNEPHNDAPRKED